MAELRYTDLLLVNRDYESYKVTGEAFYATYLNKPKIFNIDLLEVNPGALPRFTNQSFVSRTTMEDEGQPLSSKIYDAYVEGTILDDISTSVITDTNTLVDKASGVVVEVAGNFGQTGTPADLFDGSVNNFGVSQWYVDLPSIPFDNALGGVMVQGAKSISEQWSQYFYRVTGTNVPSGWWCLGAEGPGVTSWNNINTGDFPWALNNGSNVFKITGPTGTGVITKIEFMYSTTSGPSSDGSVSGTPVLATTNRVLQAAIFVNQEILLDGVELTVTDDTNLDQFVVGKEVIQNSSGTPETSAITNVVNDKNALGQITYVASYNTDSVQNAFNGESSSAMWMIYTNGVGSTSQRVELTNPINNTTGYVVVWTYNALGPQGSPNPQNQVLWVNGTPITFTATTSGINPYLVPVSTGPISNIGLGFASAANMNVSAFDLNATDIPSAKPLYLNPNDYSTLTLTNDTNLANFQVGDAVDKGTVSAIDTLNTQMDVVLTDTADVYVPTDTVTGPTLTAKGNLLRVYEADNKILVNNSTGRFFETKPEQTLNRLDKTAVQENVPVDGTKKYLEFSESGTVTGLLDAPQSPAYVTTDEDPVLTLTFPSTFPSGFTPDEELGEGVTLTIEVTAENVVGTDGPKSATVQPMVATPITSAIIQIDEEPNPNGGWKRLDTGGGANYMWGIVYSNIEKIFVTTGYNNANPTGVQGIRWSEDGLTWYPGTENGTTPISSYSNQGMAYAEDKQLYGVIGNATLPGRVSYSTSGKTGWSSFQQLNGKADSPWCITYSKYHGKFFVGGGSNSWGAWIYSSPDMINWTLTTQFPESFNGFGITSLGTNDTTGRMVAGTYDYNGGVSGPTFRLGYSDDEGATWIDCTFTQNPDTSPYKTGGFMKVCYNEEADAWVAGGGDGYTSECLWRSTDGITWTPIPETLDKEGGNTVENTSCGVSNGYFFNYKRVNYSSTHVRKILVSEDGLNWYGGPYNTVGGNEIPQNFAFDGKRTYVGTGQAISASANAWWSDDLGLPYEKLTFQDNTGLTLFSSNDVVHSLDQNPEVTRAVVDSVTPGSNQMVVKGSVGEWQLGGKVEQVIPAGVISLTAEELDAQKLKFLTYNNRKDVVCGEEASAARATLLATLTEAGYTEADINQTYSNLDN